MIYLYPFNASSLGDDTFWLWFAREFPDSKFVTAENAGDIGRGDVVLQYSTLGRADFPEAITVALCWELHHEMRDQLQSKQWDRVICKIEQCAVDATHRTVGSRLMRPCYEPLGDVDVLPIGVDTGLFCPLATPEVARRKYGIPRDTRVGFWAGTKHPMKGFDRLRKYAVQHPEIHWIIVWKTRREAGHLPGATQFMQIPQLQLAELMGCADFVLSPGRLRPFFLVEWEAMACNLPVVDITGLPQRDFRPSNSPRDDVFRLGWDRHSAKRIWGQYLREIQEK